MSKVSKIKNVGYSGTFASGKTTLEGMIDSDYTFDSIGNKYTISDAGGVVCSITFHEKIPAFFTGINFTVIDKTRELPIFGVFKPEVGRSIAVTTLLGLDISTVRDYIKKCVMEQYSLSDKCIVIDIDHDNELLNENHRYVGRDQTTDIGTVVEDGAVRVNFIPVQAESKQCVNAHLIQINGVTFNVSLWIENVSIQTFYGVRKDVFVDDGAWLEDAYKKLFLS